MTTQKILEDIRRALRKGQPIPTGDVRSLLAICDALSGVVTKQQTEISDLKAAQRTDEQRQAAVTTETAKE